MHVLKSRQDMHMHPAAAHPKHLATNPCHTKLVKVHVTAVYFPHRLRGRTDIPKIEVCYSINEFGLEFSDRWLKSFSKLHAIISFSPFIAEPVRHWKN